MEKRKMKLKGKFSGDIFLRVLSVVAAIVIWAVLSLTLYPQISNTITNVPVTVELDDTTAGEQGLSTINFDKDTKVTVTIKGMRYEIGDYSADDLKATVNLDKVTKAGTYDLDIHVQSRSGDDLTVVSVSPSKVEVTFDVIKTKTLKLNIKATGISPADGYSLDGVTLNKSDITVSGPQEKVDSIDSAAFEVDAVRELSDNYTTTNGKIAFYDADGNVIDDTNLTVTGADALSADFRIYEKKTLPLKVQFEGMPDNFNEEVLKYVISEETIDVSAPIGTLGDMSELVVGSISLKSINLENAYSFPIKLDSNIKNNSGVENVTVSFDNEGYTSKKFDLTSSNIHIKNVPSGIKVTVSTKNLNGVEIFGPESDINALKVANLSAVLDLNNTTLDSGTYTKEVTVYSPTNGNVWACGTYDITINVEK